MLQWIKRIWRVTIFKIKYIQSNLDNFNLRVDVNIKRSEHFSFFIYWTIEHSLYRDLIFQWFYAQHCTFHQRQRVSLCQKEELTSILNSQHLVSSNNYEQTKNIHRIQVKTTWFKDYLSWLYIPLLWVSPNGRILLNEIF